MERKNYRKLYEDEITSLSFEDWLCAELAVTKRCLEECRRERDKAWEKLNDIRDVVK